MMYLLVDIDHTIADSRWRDHLLGDWPQYHWTSQYDEQRANIVKIVRDLHRMGWRIIGLTARPAYTRDMTWQWLGRFNIHFDELLMREDDDERPSLDIKVNLLQNRFGAAVANCVLLEDRPEVCATLAHLGVTALQVYGMAR